MHFLLEAIIDYHSSSSTGIDDNHNDHDRYQKYQNPTSHVHTPVVEILHPVFHIIHSLNDCN